MAKRFDIKIEKALPHDAEGWCKIRKECWLEVYPNKEAGITKEDVLEKDFDSPAKIQFWQDCFVNPKSGANYFSAKIDGKVVGFCIAYIKDDENEAGALYVDKDFRRLGVGEKLIDKALSIFNRSNKTILKVAEYNNIAIKFYKKCGFEIVGPYLDEHCHLPSGKNIPELLMARELAKWQSDFFIDRFERYHIRPKNQKVTKRISAYGIAIKNEKILMIKSPDYPDWELTGGMVEEGETMEEGLKREFLEETGYVITKVLKKVGKTEKYLFFSIWKSLYFDSSMNFFLVEIDDSVQHKDKIMKEEHEKMAWLDLKTLDLKTIHWANRNIFKTLKKISVDIS